MSLLSDTDGASCLSESSTPCRLPAESSDSTDCGDQVVHPPRYSVVRVRIVTSAVTMLFSLSASPILSVMSQYLVDRLSQEQGSLNTSASNYSSCYNDANDSQATQADKLQAQVSTMIMYIAYSAACPGIISGLIIGAYADHIGRRFALILPLLGTTAKSILVTCIIRFNLDLWLFYVAFASEGVVGSGLAVFLSTYTIMADINIEKTDRVLWIAITSVLSAIMSACSNIIAGIMIKHVGFFPTSAFLMCATAATLLITLLFLPETKPQQEYRVLNLYKNVRRVFGFFLFEGTLRTKVTFTICLLTFLFGVINELGTGAIDTLYQLHSPFCWDSTLIGYYSALRTGGAHVVAIFLLACIQRWVKVEYIGLLAALSQGIAYVFEAFVKKTWQFFLVPAVGIPGCLITPVIRGIMSCHAKPDNQGALFTSVCIFEVGCLMISSTVFNKIYASTVSSFPGTVYLCMASFSGVTVLLIILYIQVHEERRLPVVYEKIVDSVDDPGTSFSSSSASLACQS